MAKAAVCGRIHAAGTPSLFPFSPFFQTELGESACRKDLPAPVSAGILHDINNSSWPEVWETHLKVSRGTDGPAGLL